VCTRKILADFPNGSVYFANLVLANATSHTQNRCVQVEKMKYTLIFLILILCFSCKSEKSKTNLTVECIEKIKVDSEYSDDILIKNCEFKNHIFKSIGTPDLKGRYSYEFELLQIGINDTLRISNTDFFNENQNELEKLLNEKLKAEYESNSKIPEISDCIKWIDFRNYKLNEFGISFNDKNRMEFNIDYGIGSACFNVSSSSVVLELTEIENYLKNETSAQQRV